MFFFCKCCEVDGQFIGEKRLNVAAKCVGNRQKKSRLPLDRSGHMYNMEVEDSGRLELRAGLETRSLTIRVRLEKVFDV
jgi:hypothetical protein